MQLFLQLGRDLLEGIEHLVSVDGVQERRIEVEDGLILLAGVIDELQEPAGGLDGQLQDA